MTRTQSVTAVGALADPIRRSLYEYIAGRHELVSREEAATATGMSLSKAKFHLDRLERDGLLEVEQRRLTGRSGPGAGRPAKLYRRASRQLRVSLPERRYDIVGAVLASAVEQSSASGDLGAAISASAYARGVLDAGESGLGEDESQGESESTSGGEGQLAGASLALARLGYEPENRGGDLVLHNCPFDTLAQEHRSIVCAMNEQYVQGVLDASCGEGLVSELAPAPGFCCVVVHDASTRSGDGGRCAQGGGS
jgi:predicted ArsR family transcriptional regulator